MDLLEKYTHSHTSPEDELLAELVRVTHQRAIHPQMLSGHVQGKLLEMFVRMIRPARVLEIGTFTGYSALSMASGLEDAARIDTIEVDDELEELAGSFFERSASRNKIRQYIGGALEIVPRLAEVYDLVFIDGDKREYPAYYRMLMGDGEFAESGAKVCSGSYLIADNILWYGKVAQPELYTDPHTKAIIEFNRMVLDDHRTENVILPLRDGLNIVRIK